MRSGTKEEPRDTDTAATRRAPSPPGFFVIWDGLGLVTKRIEHVPNSDPTRVVLKFLNPDYGSHERPAGDLSVVGRSGSPEDCKGTRPVRSLPLVDRS